MRIVIVTGMSGAGKTTVLKIFEDIGYHCVDNLPPSLIENFATLCTANESKITQVALGIDIRGGKLFDDLAAGLSALDALDVEYSILFLDASDEVLLKRYKETRHTHPLAKNDLVSVGIAKERPLLETIKKRATYIIDTSFILTRQLREKIMTIFVENVDFDSMIIHILSFGYKYGIPEEADLVFDVRFLPNPFYNAELKPLTGLDQPVWDYVMSHDASVEFLEHITELLRFLIPHYISEGKNQLIVGIGCTGGRHRSVTLASSLHWILAKDKHSIVLNHRDISKDPTRQEKG